MSAINGDSIAARAFMHFAHLAGKTGSNSYSKIGTVNIFKPSLTDENAFRKAAAEPVHSRRVNPRGIGEWHCERDESSFSVRTIHLGNINDWLIANRLI